MLYSCYVSIQFYNNNNTPWAEGGGRGLQGMLALTYTFKNLVKNFFHYVSLYAHQLIMMHGVHFATLKLSSKMTFLVPKNPFLTILFFCKIGILYHKSHCQGKHIFANAASSLPILQV